MSGSEDLKAENARLSARVAELEAQVAKTRVDRQSLYRMTDAAPWGTLVLDRGRTIEYANPAMQRWLTRPVPAVGATREEAIIPGLLALLEAPIERALSGQPATIEEHLADATGLVRALRVHVAPRASGSAGVTGCVVYLFDRTKAEALDRSVRENEARLAHINAVTPSVIYIIDVRMGRPVWAGGRIGSILGYTAEEIEQNAAQLRGGLVHPDDRPRAIARIIELAGRPDGDVIELELRARRKDGSFRWVLDRCAVFERNAEGGVVKTISAAIDIDERKRAEERRTLLINELNHRVKNTLAAVQSIARQTLRGGHSPHETIEIFTARLVALSAAHDVLTRENWEGAGLREIVDGALRPFAQSEGRIRTAGPDVRLGSRAALGLAMALHELATNAVKHGALSGDAGAVDLTWRARKAGRAARLELEWRESGGPPVLPPTRTGFGSRLLTQGLPAELDGTAELDYAPTGLVCRISAPLEATPLLALT